MGFRCRPNVTNTAAAFYEECCREGGRQLSQWNTAAIRWAGGNAVLLVSGYGLLGGCWEHGLAVFGCLPLSRGGGYQQSMDQKSGLPGRPRVPVTVESDGITGQNARG